jgi:PPP family 3-phenylpropionic acid transporter
MSPINPAKRPNPIPPHTLSAAMYFSYYMAFGCFMPYINLYYERLGLSGIQIGTLAAVPVVVGSSTVLIWGSIADKFQWHRGILRASFLLGGVAVFLLSTAESFPELLIFVIIFAFFSSSTVPLLDSAALEAAESSGHTYGQLRLWGSVGWSISAVLIGFIIQSLAIKWLFYAYIIVILLTFLLSLFQSRRMELPQSSLSSGYKQLLYNRPFLLFLFSIFLLALTLSASNSFYSIYLDAIGTGETGIGIGWAIASLIEIPVMLYSGRFLNRIGAAGLLKIAIITFAIRLLIFSFTTTPALAIGLQTLSGISFAFYLVGGVTYVKEQTPKGLSTTAQSIYNFVSFGIGSIAGSLIGGYLYETAGIAWLFRLLSILALTAFVVLLISQRSLNPLTPSAAQTDIRPEA